MTPQHVISQLLESDTTYPRNLDLLKKIIITTYLGRFRVNSLAPDNKVSLGSYLFDEERVMFDFTRLSDESKELFQQWLLEPYEYQKEEVFFSGVSINEYRGFTAESLLTWWGRLKRWWQGMVTERWPINDFELSLNYQLIGIEMSHGKHGILVGFDHYFVPPSGSKYKDPDDFQNEPLGNTKRVFLSDNIVRKLIGLDFSNLDFSRICKGHHPHAVDVIDPSVRFSEMQDYRNMQKFVAIKPWYVRLWLWIISFFQEENIKKPEENDNSLQLIYETETVHIYQRKRTNEIIVSETKPDIDNVVYCGGGAKIFAHVGVWKALNESGIIPHQFAGSSAGGIMALLCYLGYSADEITEFFKRFKQEHLVHFDIKSNGLSDPNSLKTAVDYAIVYKLNQILTHYGKPFPRGKITFTTLEQIRQECPGCGLGEELVVTATNKKMRKTRYFSLSRSPDMEVSEAVKTSASFPVLYRPTLIDGEEHNDGGVLSNFPTEAFSDDHATFLESEYGNNLKILAVQFDNGTERNTIDRVMDKVYRENFILNWIYRLLTGVSDPASGWEQDRMKLRKYAAQSVVVDVGDTSAAGFSVDEATRKKMIDSGYQSTKDYLEVRYGTCDGERYTNKELMYSTFSSLGDLLAYCCFRNDKAWFEVVNNLIVQSNLENKTALRKQSIVLRNLYFNENQSDVGPKPENSPTFFGNSVPQQAAVISEDPENPYFFMALYPVFLKLTSKLVQTKADQALFARAWHSIRLHAPFHALTYLKDLSGPVHVVIQILIHLMLELKNNPCERSYANIKELSALLHSSIDIFKDDLYSTTVLTYQQSLRMLKLLNKGHLGSAALLLGTLGENCEPLQVITGGVFHDDFVFDPMTLS